MLTPINLTKAVLLLNMGSPNRPEGPEVRRYLREVLMDKRMIDRSWLFRWMLVSGVIVPFRWKQSVAAYRRIWTEEGSPLIVWSRQLLQRVTRGVHIPVALAMRYGKPSIEEAVESFIKRGIKELLVIPLYPQYAISSYETTVVQVQELVSDRMQVSVHPPFYNHSDYIVALVESASSFLKKDYDQFLFCFHSLPLRHVKKTSFPVDYREQCIETAEAFARLANISHYLVGFQSPLGRKSRWLGPHVEQLFRELPKQGVRKLLVICPSFVTECLETLEEIAITGKNLFLESGGKAFWQIPCLNDHPVWVEVLQDKIRKWSRSK